MSIGFARRVALTLAVAIASGLFVSAAQAGIVVDLRLKGVTGTAFQIVDTKKVQYTYEGSGSIQFEAWAIVTGAPGNSALEAFQSIYGSFLSSNVDGGVVFGTLSGSLTPVFFNGGASATTIGASADLDGDGDLDLGSNNMSNPSDGWMFARASAMQNTSNASNTPPEAFQALADGGIAIKFADLTFTLTGDVGAPPVTAKTNLAWNSIPDGTVYNSAVWREDGVSKSPAIGSTILSTGPIEIVPEPASIALVTLLGAVALVWFRRR